MTAVSYTHLAWEWATFDKAEGCPVDFWTQKTDQELVVEAVTRLVRNVMRQKRMTKHVEVAHCVQNLVLDELVVLAQAARIENAELVHHDGVLERTALSEPHAAKHLHRCV